MMNSEQLNHTEDAVLFPVPNGMRVYVGGDDGPGITHFAIELRSGPTGRWVDVGTVTTFDGGGAVAEDHLNETHQFDDGFIACEVLARRWQAFVDVTDSYDMRDHRWSLYDPGW